MSRTKSRSRRLSTGTAPTIKQVAARAGVSTATVSRVQSGYSSVSDDLRERVLDAVQELNYQPNLIARSLRVQRTTMIGVVLPDIQNTFFTSILHGIEDGLQQEDYTLLFSNSNDNIERERRMLLALQAERVAGIIFVPISNDPAEYLPLLQGGMPLVAIDRAPEGLGIGTVSVKNAEGASAAIRYLISLGHHRIGMISGPPETSTGSERLEGYVQTLGQAGLALDDRLIAYGDFRKESGYDAMQALLALPDPPTAVFVANSLMTLGALRAINERRLHIPSDISVLCFDDPEWADAYVPALTVVQQPTYQLGLTAARLLLARIRDQDQPIKPVALDTQLIVRESCGPGLRQFEYGRTF